MLLQTVAVETEIKAAHAKDFLFLTTTAHLRSPNAFQSYLLPCNWTDEYRHLLFQTSFNNCCCYRRPEQLSGFTPLCHHTKSALLHFEITEFFIHISILIHTV